jgi:hypothetical protein
MNIFPVFQSRKYDLQARSIRYNAATPLERDAIDAAFVWMTGDTPATISAIARRRSGRGR